jgi:hypothetical protein
MKDTVEVLDRKLKSYLDPHSPNAPANVRLSTQLEMDHNGNSNWLVVRYQARAKAMEELANIYKQSLQSLSPGGPLSKLLSYEHLEAEYNGATNTSATGSTYRRTSVLALKIAVNWIEKEINTVRGSYDEELKGLEAEVVDLQVKLKEQQVYEGELRRQLEDFTKSFYRYICQVCIH